MDLDDPRLADIRAANLKNWNERVAGHIAPDGYDIDRLVDDPEYLTDVVDFDRHVLGDVSGRTLPHSQCHVGTDTMSWAKLGASVTGFDFSPDALAAAGDIAARLGLPARFVETEFYDAPAAIQDRFDIVYTSVGAICWLPDITSWAQILADFTKPGGTFYIRDSHPIMMALDDEREDRALVVTYPYFHRPEPLSFTDPNSYSGSASLENATTFEWPHPLADVINAVIGAGLRIERVEELQHLDWQFLDHMERRGRVHVLPDDQRDLVPLQFSILATKPET